MITANGLRADFGKPSSLTIRPLTEIEGSVKYKKLTYYSYYLDYGNVKIEI